MLKEIVIKESYWCLVIKHRITNAIFVAKALQKDELRGNL
jgi:hypothetical protein